MFGRQVQRRCRRHEDQLIKHAGSFRQSDDSSPAPVDVKPPKRLARWVALRVIAVRDLVSDCRDLGSLGTKYGDLKKSDSANVSRRRWEKDGKWKTAGSK